LIDAATPSWLPRWPFSPRFRASFHCLSLAAAIDEPFAFCASAGARFSPRSAAPFSFAADAAFFDFDISLRH